MTFKNSFIAILVIAVAILVYFVLQKPDKEYVRIKVPVPIEVAIPQKVITFPPAKLPTPKKEVYKPVDVVYDSEKDSLLKELSAERTYVEIFTSPEGEVEITSITKGYLLSQWPKITMYPDTVVVTKWIEKDIEIPKRFKMYGGVEAGVPIDINNFDPIFKGSILLQNKKERIISLGFDTNKQAWVGYYMKF